MPFTLVNPIFVSRDGHLRAHFDVIGLDRGQYQVHLRVSEEDALDFSAVLSYRLRSTNTWIILRRYNGKAHEHRNPIEKEPVFFDYHIHMATERYQRAPGRKPETYAVVTTRYVDIHGAIECLVEDCGFFKDPAKQRDLFYLDEDSDN